MCWFPITISLLETIEAVPLIWWFLKIGYPPKWLVYQMINKGWFMQGYPYDLRNRPIWNGSTKWQVRSRDLNGQRSGIFSFPIQTCPLLLSFFWGFWVLNWGTLNIPFRANALDRGKRFSVPPTLTKVGNWVINCTMWAANHLELEPLVNRTRGELRYNGRCNLMSMWVGYGFQLLRTLLLDIPWNSKTSLGWFM